jgi:hypothetical protein
LLPPLLPLRRRKCTEGTQTVTGKDNTEENLQDTKDERRRTRKREEEGEGEERERERE